MTYDNNCSLIRKVHYNHYLGKTVKELLANDTLYDYKTAGVQYDGDSSIKFLYTTYPCGAMLMLHINKNKDILREVRQCKNVGLYGEIHLKRFNLLSNAKITDYDIFYKYRSLQDSMEFLNLPQTKAESDSILKHLNNAFFTKFIGKTVRCFLNDNLIRKHKGYSFYDEPTGSLAMVGLKLSKHISVTIYVTGQQDEIKHDFKYTTIKMAENLKILMFEVEYYDTDMKKNIVDNYYR